MTVTQSKIMLLHRVCHIFWSWNSRLNLEAVIAEHWSNFSAPTKQTSPVFNATPKGWIKHSLCPSVCLSVHQFIHSSHVLAVTLLPFITFLPRVSLRYCWVCSYNELLIKTFVLQFFKVLWWKKNPSVSIWWHKTG